MDAAVVELDPLADAVRPGAEDHDSRLVAPGRCLFGLAPGRVEVVRSRFDLARAGVDPAIDRLYAPGPPLCADDCLGHAAALRHVRVRDPQALEGQPVVGDEVVDALDPGQRAGDAVELGLEPRVHPVRHRAQRGPWCRGSRVELAGAHGLHEGLGEGAADAHRLADRLHLGAQRGVGAGELLEGEARELDDHVVESRLEAGRGGAGEVVRDLVQRVADRELRGDLGDRIAGRLRRERRGARHARVHLDHAQLAGPALARELDVRAAGLDPDGAHDGERRVAQLLVGLVREGHLRRDRDRVAGVHAHRVEVLDRADDDRVVVPVSHDLELELVPAEQRLLDEHLADRALAERSVEQLFELLGRARRATTVAAERESRAEDDRERQRFRKLGGRRDDGRLGHPEAGELHGLAEALSVLGAADDVDRGADQLDAEVGQRARLGQLDGQVQRRLATHRRQQRVGALTAQDVGNAVEVQRLDVRPVGEPGVGHDRRRVRVDDDRPEPVLAQHLQRLAARVVELAGLADDDRAGADQADGLEVKPPWQGPPPGRSHRGSARRRAGPGRPRGGTGRSARRGSGSRGPRRFRRTARRRSPRAPR